MEKYKAIPSGYMTVGELAKKLGVTVRTLQHYDKAGFFSPSAESEGGRRLYTDKDLIRLYQILTLKHLGFSLQDIKSRVISLDTPEEVATVLTEQATDIKRKIESLTKAYEEIEQLKIEVLQIQSVDFKKYADIVVNLQLKNEHYWLIKHFDEPTLDYIRSRFSMESGTAFMNNFTRLNDQILELQKANAQPNCKEAQELAKAYWDMIMDFTDGDMSLLPNLMKIANTSESNNENSEEWVKKITLVNAYIEKALDVYFTNLGIDPFVEELK